MMVSHKIFLFGKIQRGIFSSFELFQTDIYGYFHHLNWSFAELEGVATPLSYENLNLEMIRSFQTLLYSICIILASEASQKKIYN